MNRTKISIPKELLLKKFFTPQLSFFIGHIKSREPCIVTPCLELYNVKKQLTKTLQQTAFVIASNYKEKVFNYELTEDELNDTAYVRIALIVDNLSSENPIYFNELMLCEGNYETYHQPEEIIEESTIYFVNNYYVNLYNTNKNTYLQVIRPHYDRFTTTQLTKSKQTVLAPHLDDEPEEDTPENIALEYMNMHDQTIEILR